MITKDKLEELRRLEKAATPARWQSNGDGTEVTGPEFFDNDGNDWQSICGSFPHKGNANLIAAARNALPELLDEIERLRDALQVIASRKGMTQLSDCCVIQACTPEYDDGKMTSHCKYQAGVARGFGECAAFAEEVLGLKP